MLAFSSFGMHRVHTNAHLVERELQVAGKGSCLRRYLQAGEAFLINRWLRWCHEKDKYLPLWEGWAWGHQSFNSRSSKSSSFIIINLKVCIVLRKSGAFLSLVEGLYLYLISKQQNRNFSLLVFMMAALFIPGKHIFTSSKGYSNVNKASFLTLSHFW